MELTDHHIEFIKKDIESKGITMADLADSIVDHICCTLENYHGSNFHQAYRNAVDAFGSERLPKIQQETILLISKSEITMKKTMFVLGYIAALLSSTGLLFKLMHWPGASIMLVLGIALLNFGFLPMYFYDRYKRAAGLAAS